MHVSRKNIFIEFNILCCSLTISLSGYCFSYQEITVRKLTLCKCYVFLIEPRGLLCLDCGYDQIQRRNYDCCFPNCKNKKPLFITLLTCKYSKSFFVLSITGNNGKSIYLKQRFNCIKYEYFTNIIFFFAINISFTYVFGGAENPFASSLGLEIVVI